MDPGTVFCPTLECPASGPPGQGPIGSHSRQAKRFSCRQGRKTFTTPTGPGCYRLRPAAATGVMVITGLAPGWPPQAIVAACGLEERTGADGLARAGRQGPTVHALLGEPPRDLGQVQAAAIRVQNQGGLRWWALARMIRTRGGLAGEVSAPRARRLSRRRIARVRRGAAPRPLLVGIDGLKADVRTLRKTFRDPVRPGPPGRPRRHAWQTLCRAPVGQRDAPRRGGDGERRMVDDTPARLERRRHRSPGPGVSNTADLAPLNAML